ncbi:unnamed protein product [Allacma fusca]|uniref:Uncharacterized protein n=1 Tax=Allacma fusca TaxID=39272 RepID=A0A8J2P1C0_9HEXA|nr:unnamed protein product [Allacma fusca]
MTRRTQFFFYNVSQVMQDQLCEDEIKVRERIEFSKAELKFHAFIDYREYVEEYFDKKRPVTHLGTAGFQLCF